MFAGLKPVTMTACGVSQAYATDSEVPISQLETRILQHLVSTPAMGPAVQIET